MSSNRGFSGNNRRGRSRGSRSRGFKHVGRPSFKNKYSEIKNYEQLLEEDVGITEFISDTEGFTGIIKARYSDFQVNEIDLDGNITKLTDTKIPKDFALKLVTVDYRGVDKSPIEHIPQEIWEGILNILSSGVTAEPVLLGIDGVSKDHRKEIHGCVKSHFGKKIISNTVDRQGKKFIQFKKYNKDEDRKEHFQWPQDKGEHVHFIVYKENMNTADACFALSSALRISPSNFNHAGNKDRRSVSSQWFSAKKVEPWKLAKHTSNMFHLKVGNYTFKDHPLKLGQLQGNKFRIALRNVTADDSILEKALTQLKQNGFINYYGLQRFGNDKEVPTFKIGLSLLQGKWKEAIDLILKPKPSDNQEDIIKAKQIFAETGNAEEAYKALNQNRNQDIEVKLLEGLKKGHQNEYVNSLENVPRSMRLLYLHAFQSLVWNQMVSKRIKLFGLKPVEGDLVITVEAPELSSPDSLEADKDSDAMEEDKDSVEADNTEGADDFSCKKAVRALNSDDLPNYTIYDIVLPLPGYDIVYPENMKQYYKETLEDYGLNLEMTKQKVKTYTLSGDYRKILGKVEDFSWKIMKYSHPNDTLIRSDFQEIKGHKEPQSKEDGQYKALVLEFNLPSSGYATMAIRDMTKINTSSLANSKLNDYHVEKSERDPQVPKPVIIHTDNEAKVKEEEVEETPVNSLLADPKKYEEFKNSLFSNLGPSEKRSHEEENEEEANKKQKTVKEEAE